MTSPSVRCKLFLMVINSQRQCPYPRQISMPPCPHAHFQANVATFHAGMRTFGNAPGRRKKYNLFWATNLSTNITFHHILKH